MKCCGPKRITWLAFVMTSLACFIMSTIKNRRPDVVTETVWAQFWEAVIFYFDSSIAGYLLICIGAAFLTTASFEEVMSGTQSKLIKTKFKETSKSQLFVEAAFIVQSLIQLSILLGPIIGGLMKDGYGIQATCYQMGITSTIFLIIYTVLAIFVYCTSYTEVRLSLENEDEDPQNVRPELQSILKTLNNETMDDQLPQVSNMRDRTIPSAFRAGKAKEGFNLSFKAGSLNLNPPIETLDESSNKNSQQDLEQAQLIRGHGAAEEGQLSGNKKFQ